MSENSSDIGSEISDLIDPLVQALETAIIDGQVGTIKRLLDDGVGMQLM
jgi:hypothetical protein